MEHIIAAAESWSKHLKNMASQIDLDLENYRKARQVARQAPALAKKPRSARNLSPAARERIAAAQKKRWAEHRKAKSE